MLSQATRLLALIALALMPITMAATPASSHAMPAMTDGHCDDQQQPRSVDMAQCMLMCAALPAAEALTIAAPVVPKAPLRLTLADPIGGIVLEIATPPPRNA